MNPDANRRRLLLGLSGLLLAGPAVASGLLATPRQPAGPFYPEELPLDHDNDLTRVAGQSGRAAGRITDLAGRVLDTAGRPVPGARIEIWQCDAQGRYRHPLDPGDAPIDPTFQGFGRTQSDGAGRYRFRTIRPVPYPGRTPHIHVAVFVDGEPPLVTQLYVAGEPLNDGDFLYRRIPAERRGLLTAGFLPVAGGEAELAATFDIVLGRDGTPAA
jgi:protocatechuate 3,4-dioxygenase beta subunit